MRWVAPTEKDTANETLEKRTPPRLARGFGCSHRWGKVFLGPTKRR